MLEIKNLYSGYDEKDILKDINFNDEIIIMPLSFLASS